MHGTSFTPDQALGFAELLASEPSFHPTVKDLEFCRAFLISMVLSKADKAQLQELIAKGQSRLRASQEQPEVDRFMTVDPWQLQELQELAQERELVLA